MSIMMCLGFGGVPEARSDGQETLDLCSGGMFSSGAVSTLFNDNHCKTEPFVDRQLFQCDFVDQKPIDNRYEGTLERKILGYRNVHIYVCVTKKGKEEWYCCQWREEP